MQKEDQRPRLVSPRPSSLRSIGGDELAAVLGEHRKWVESGGREGRQADLSYGNLEGVDLSGAQLQKASLRKANLNWADLSLADLEDACLLRADLRETYLLGTNLRGADLQGATLAGATGLSVPQLAGANLSGAVLPSPTAELEKLQSMGTASRTVHRLFWLMLLVNCVGWYLIASISDAQLLGNTFLPHVSSALPTQGFFLIAPLVLLGLYVCFQYYLQRLWESLAESPAIFSDGLSLAHKKEPGFLAGLIRARWKWLRQFRPPRTSLETAISMFLIHGVTLATLCLFWGRYLTRQELRGSLFHVVVVMCCAALGMFFRHLFGKTFSWQFLAIREASSRALTPKRVSSVLGIGLVLSLLSIGVIYGAPHDTLRAPGLNQTDVRRWAAHVFWSVGYDPYPNLTGSEVSIRPENLSSDNGGLDRVEGAQLQKSTLRYLEGYRAFLAKSDLWRADLRHALLYEADLRYANLRQGDLRFAMLGRARLSHSNLHEATLDQSRLARADLQHADLSYASLYGATLVEADLEHAGLYGADLQAAQLSDASLRNADLRRAKLSGARLDRADLRGAILQGTDFSGASLEKTDLRNALFLGADQICSATGRNGLKLDENLRQQVERQCEASELED